MAEPVHVLELLVEIEPLGPAVDRVAAAGAAPIAVAAASIGRGLGKVRALAELLQDRAGPPVKMRVDDVHGAASELLRGSLRELIYRHNFTVRSRTGQ